MKKIFAIFLMLLFITGAYAQNTDSIGMDGNSTIIVDLKPKINETKTGDDVLIIKNPKTNKEWKITYSEWFTMTTSYHYWKQVSTQKPAVSEVYEDDIYLYIIFNYYDESTKDFLGIKINKTKESILSGKVLVPKKYLVARDTKKLTIMYGVSAGLGIYSALVTFLFLLAIL